MVKISFFIFQIHNLLPKLRKPRNFQKIVYRLADQTCFINVVLKGDFLVLGNFTMAIIKNGNNNSFGKKFDDPDRYPIG